jgi:hypothetical protein
MRKGLNSVAKETSSSEGTGKQSQAFSFAFFTASRKKNLLLKFAPNCGYPINQRSAQNPIDETRETRHRPPPSGAGADTNWALRTP